MVEKLLELTLPNLGTKKKQRQENINIILIFLNMFKKCIMYMFIKNSNAIINN